MEFFPTASRRSKKRRMKSQQARRALVDGMLDNRPTMTGRTASMSCSSSHFSMPLSRTRWPSSTSETTATRRISRARSFSLASARKLASAVSLTSSAMASPTARCASRCSTARRQRVTTRLLNSSARTASASHASYATAKTRHSARSISLFSSMACRLRPSN